MGLFSGLEKFGLGKLEKMDVFEEEKKRDEDISRDISYYSCI